MDVLRQVEWLAGYVLHDDRFLANVTAIGVGLFAALLIWIILRSLVMTLWATLSHLSRNPSFKHLGDQAVVLIRQSLWWLFVFASMATLVLGGGYHLYGGDVGLDVKSVYNQITPQQIARWSRTIVILFLLAGATSKKLWATMFGHSAPAWRTASIRLPMMSSSAGSSLPLIRN